MAAAITLLAFLPVRVLGGYTNTDLKGPLVGDISTWPHFFHGFVPLDMLVAFGCLWLAIGASQHLVWHTMPSWAAQTTLVFGAIGGGIGLLTAVLDGWFLALTAFVSAGALLTVFVAVLFAVSDYLIKLSETGGLKNGIRAQWSDGAGGRLTGRARHYFGAHDLAGEASPTPPDESATSSEPTALVVVDRS